MKAFFQHLSMDRTDMIDQSQNDSLPWNQAATDKPHSSWMATTRMIVWLCSRSRWACFMPHVLLESMIWMAMKLLPSKTSDHAFLTFIHAVHMLCLWCLRRSFQWTGIPWYSITTWYWKITPVQLENGCETLGKKCFLTILIMHAPKFFRINMHAYYSNNVRGYIGSQG